jgi:DNA-binding response OmpR family regulator
VGQDHNEHYGNCSCSEVNNGKARLETTLIPANENVSWLPAEEIVSSPAHVLLIEDCQEDADLIRMRLLESNSDFAVSHTDRLSTGLVALEAGLPAVVLLDLNLPDIHGVEAFRSVLNKAPRMPVVVLSGVEDEELSLRAVHEGVQDYLVKGTVDGKQLGRSLRYAIERQKLLNALYSSRRQPPQFKGNDTLATQSLAAMKTQSEVTNEVCELRNLCAVLHQKQVALDRIQEEIDMLNRVILLLADEDASSISVRRQLVQSRFSV